MIKKPMARSVIAAAVVAGILTLCLVATKPLANHAFAEESCSLTLKADPGSGEVAAGESISQVLSGHLSCGKNDVRSATIVLTGLTVSGGVEPHVTTDSSGDYKYTIRQTAGTTFTIKAHYAGGCGESEAPKSTVLALGFYEGKPCPSPPPASATAGALSPADSESTTIDLKEKPA